MPRPKKKSPEEKATQKIREEILSKFWTDRIKAGKEEKKDYAATAAEVLQFFKAKHDGLYDSTDASDFMSFDGAATVSVPMVAKMKNSLGPRLYVAAPTITVIPRSPDGVMIAFGRAMGAYLTYTAKEARFARGVRKSVDDGLIRGRVMFRQIWDDVRKIVTSVHLPSTDFVFDPDFEQIEDAKWIAIRHREPLWALKDRLPKWRMKNMDRMADDGGVIGMDSEDSPEEDPDEDNGSTKAARATATVVEWWEILSKMGAGARGAHVSKQVKNYDKDTKDFVRICVVLGHHCLLEEGEWDVPLYLDRDWPVSYTDFVETPGQSWPESPMGQVLSLQKAVDLLTSLRLSSCKNRDRVVVFADAKIAAEAQEVLRKGTSADFIPLKLPSGYSLDMVMKVADFGQGAQESAAEREYLQKEIEVTVGTTSMVTGGQDQQAQDRSATATQLRNSASEVRSADLENKVSEVMTDAARKEAIMTRLFVDEDDFVPIVKVTDIQMFYVSIMLPGGAEIPLRPDKLGEEEDPKAPARPLTVMDLAPGAATFFETPVAAAQALEALWGEIMASMDPRVGPIRDFLLQDMDPTTMIPAGIQVMPVTSKHVWRTTAGLTAAEIMRELAFDLEAGRGVKFDKATERQNTDTLMQFAMPIMSQMGDFEGLNGLLKMRYAAYQTPKDKQVFFTPPPALGPQAQQQSGGSEDEGEGPPKQEGE